MTYPSKLPASAQGVPPPSLPTSSGSRSAFSYLSGSQKEDSAASSQSIKKKKRNRATTAAAIQRTRGRGIRISDVASSPPHNTQPNTERVPMSPITRGVASLSPTTDGIDSVSHATERVPIVSLNEQGVLDEFDTNKEKRKPRGRAKLSFLSKGKQLHVEFITRGQPFGENTAKFSFLFGATSRELLPVTLKKRKDLAEEFINQLWGHAQRKESETPDAIIRANVWIRGHTKKGGGFLNEDVADAVVMSSDIPA
ncbi:hypothetical protein LWI29_029437 [Acer saccharum]|uniref:Uncharacterized protein n=1 Tax=Acer saccharum TaxID=4024 RepID=A0AA39VIC8_ACESA|nr:hypothetical protein LWI29_029437 [Acer saccharum]